MWYPAVTMAHHSLGKQQMEILDACVNAIQDGRLLPISRLTRLNLAIRRLPQAVALAVAPEKMLKVGSKTIQCINYCVYILVLYCYM